MILKNSRPNEDPPATCTGMVRSGNYHTEENKREPSQRRKWKILAGRQNERRRDTDDQKYGTSLWGGGSWSGPLEITALQIQNIYFSTSASIQKPPIKSKSIDGSQSRCSLGRKKLLEGGFFSTFQQVANLCISSHSLKKHCWTLFFQWLFLEIVFASQTLAFIF